MAGVLQINDDHFLESISYMRTTSQHTLLPVKHLSTMECFALFIPCNTSVMLCLGCVPRASQCVSFWQPALLSGVEQLLQLRTAAVPYTGIPEDKICCENQFSGRDVAKTSSIKSRSMSRKGIGQKKCFNDICKAYVFLNWLLPSIY